MDDQYAIHWFRRDLRVAGNLSLQRQFSQFKGRVVGVFFFDSDFLSRDDFSHNRFQFFIETLSHLKSELQSIGSDLLVLDDLPENGFPNLLKTLKIRPSSVSFSRDYEPFARKRDEKIKNILEENRVEVYTNRDHLLIEPWELSKDDGTPYKVYTPFSKRWLKLFCTEKIADRVVIHKKSEAYLETLFIKKHKPFFKLKWNDLLGFDPIKIDKCIEFLKENQKKVTIEIPPSGSLNAYLKLKEFKEKLSFYKDKRDMPSLDGTSKLAMFLKNGSLTTSQIIHYLNLTPYDSKDDGPSTFFSEIIWREFYYHILHHYPEVEHLEFVEKYRDLKWENNLEHLQKWKDGMTGFPIVDAGMRELKQTGHMHNRVRMIVASFLTKDLLIDWRYGERYFMEMLLDGDLSANNGGWQWAASTGCDAQPYFRIFNPWSQSKKFDSDGTYIKQYIPELADLNPKELHAPIEGHKSYPPPIVDHGTQRNKVLLLYKA